MAHRLSKYYPTLFQMINHFYNFSIRQKHRIRFSSRGYIVNFYCKLHYVVRAFIGIIFLLTLNPYYTGFQPQLNGVTHILGKK